MSGVSLVQEIIGILTAGLVDFGEALGTGVQSLVDGLFFTTTGTGADATTTLSTFGVLILAFAAIALCVGLSRVIIRWISSLGGSRIG